MALDERRVDRPTDELACCCWQRGKENKNMKYSVDKISGSPDLDINSKCGRLQRTASIAARESEMQK
jgi:hypothetical protein